MIRKKKIGQEASPRVTIRLDEETFDFYNSEAGHHRLDLSQYLRQLLMRGVIAANAAEIQENFREAAAEIQANWRGKGSTVPDEIILSLFTVEELFKKLVGEKNMQTYYEAKNKAQARLKEYTGE